MPLPGNIGCVLLGGAALLAPPAPAGQLAALTVGFAPPAAAQLQLYGSEEPAVLRAAILAAVARATEPVVIAQGLAASVTVLEVAPTHPTREQLGAEPTLDVLRTTYVGGGAELSGEVRDADQHLVTTVSYRYFAPWLSQVSSARDPWADAYRAINEFAARLAAACRTRARAD
jgi:hypothetical protein